MNLYNNSVKALVCLLIFGVSPVFAEGDVKTETKAETKTEAKAETKTKVSSDRFNAVEALSGFTIGVDVVYSHTDVRHDQKPVNMSDFTGGPVTDVESAQVNQSRCFVDPSVNVGYSYLKDNFYVGIAGDFSFGKKAEVTYDLSDSGNVEAKTKIDKFSYGVKLKGGYYSGCLKSLFYGIAGVKWRDASFRVVYKGEEGTKAKVKTPFFVLGLGMERPIRDKFSFSAEYECAWRNSTKATTLGAGSADIDQRLRENTLKLGIKYHI